MNSFQYGKMYDTGVVCVALGCACVCCVGIWECIIIVRTVSPQGEL